MSHVWDYDEYSDWSRLLARSYSVPELEKRLAKATGATERAKGAHLRAVQATSSMGGQSQRRAQSRNSMTASYEESRALADAIELHQLYPDQLKERYDRRDA